MRKAALLNAPVVRVLSLLGHGDSICICDAGLPIPDGVERIDLAVHAGLPGFLETLTTITAEMYVETAIIATEFAAQQADQHDKTLRVLEALGQDQDRPVEVTNLPHESFKERSRLCKAIIRTGECTPYSNIILSAGVTF